MPWVREVKGRLRITFLCSITSTFVLPMGKGVILAAVRIGKVVLSSQVALANQAMINGQEKDRKSVRSWTNGNVSINAYFARSLIPGGRGMRLDLGVRTAKSGRRTRYGNAKRSAAGTK